MKTRLIAIFGTLTALAAALTPIAEAAGRWGKAHRVRTLREGGHWPPSPRNPIVIVGA